MNKARLKFQIHAVIHRNSAGTAGFDDVLAGRPIERRLNRMERVVAAYRDVIDERINNGLHVTFHSADAALLGACEMQHRCSVLPQLSRNWLALRIGIHQGVVRQRSKDNLDNTLEIASQLATIDDGIVVSDAVVSGLNPELLKLVRPLKDSPAETGAHTVDWRREIPTAAFGGESMWPASHHSHSNGTLLILHHGLKTLELTLENPVARVGRDPSNNLVMSDDRVSRMHCHIECRDGRVILTDSSTNGTSVAPDGGEELVVKRTSVDLKGKGLLFFGRNFDGERRGGIRYETR